MIIGIHRVRTLTFFFSIPGTYQEYWIWNLRPLGISFWLRVLGLRGTIRGVTVVLVELFGNFVNKCHLPERDDLRSLVTFNRNSNAEPCFAEISYFPVLLELQFKMLILLLEVCHGHKIINVYGYHDCSMFGLPVVDVVFASQLSEAPAKHFLVHGFIPYMSTLFHSVESLLEFPNPVYLTRFFKAWWLLHVADFVRTAEAV